MDVAAAIIGICLIVAGIALYSIPAAIIVLGGIILTFALLYDTGHPE